MSFCWVKVTCPSCSVRVCSPQFSSLTSSASMRSGDAASSSRVKLVDHLPSSGVVVGDAPTLAGVVALDALGLADALGLVDAPAHAVAPTTISTADATNPRRSTMLHHSLRGHLGR